MRPSFPTALLLLVTALPVVAQEPTLPESGGQPKTGSSDRKARGFKKDEQPKPFQHTWVLQVRRFDDSAGAVDPLASLPGVARVVRNPNKRFLELQLVDNPKSTLANPADIWKRAEDMGLEPFRLLVAEGAFTSRPAAGVSPEPHISEKSRETQSEFPAKRTPFGAKAKNNAAAMNDAAFDAPAPGPSSSTTKVASGRDVKPNSADATRTSSAVKRSELSASASDRRAEMKSAHDWYQKARKK